MEFACAFKCLQEILLQKLIFGEHMRIILVVLEKVRDFVNAFLYSILCFANVSKLQAFSFFFLYQLFIYTILGCMLIYLGYVENNNLRWIVGVYYFMVLKDIGLAISFYTIVVPVIALLLWYWQIQKYQISNALFDVNDMAVALILLFLIFGVCGFHMAVLLCLDVF